MTRGSINAKIVAAKVEAIQRSLAGIDSLPLASIEDFVADPRMVAAGESYLRRALEALLDLGRHLLAKGAGRAAIEYKAIPQLLAEEGILAPDLSQRLTRMAGYRNRLVHFYDDVTPPELFAVLTEHLGDVERVLDALRRWIAQRGDAVEEEL